MKDRTEVEEVRAYWDSDPYEESDHGWVVECLVDGMCVEMSAQVWFPFDVDEYGAHQGGDLMAALRKEYPRATIEVVGDEYTLTGGGES